MSKTAEERAQELLEDIAWLEVAQSEQVRFIAQAIREAEACSLAEGYEAGLHDGEAQGWRAMRLQASKIAYEHGGADGLVISGKIVACTLPLTLPEALAKGDKQERDDA